MNEPPSQNSRIHRQTSADAERACAARLAPEVAALFPAGVVAAQLAGEADPALLHPEERKVVQHVAPRRLKDYAAGRECARLALGELGIRDFALLPAGDRQPRWPPGITGSISHTQGYCIAAVARLTVTPQPIRSIGLDVESAEAVHEELWPRICRPEELEWLARHNAQERVRLAGLIFAAKESFYKSQYPLTGEWIGFEEVLIEPLSEPLIEPLSASAGAGGLLVRPQRPIRLETHAAMPLRGTFRFHERWVIAGVTVP